MPVVQTSAVRPPWFQLDGHFQTIIPALFRNVNGFDYSRERIPTPDEDFLDLDWSKIGSRRVAIISHGLEGDTGRPYMRGMTRALNGAGWDVLAWNYRGCSQEMNRTRRFYHSGETTDLGLVVDHVRCMDYDQIDLIGFSLGGNLTLKYLGEQGSASDIHRSVTFSVPLDLHRSCIQISLRSNYMYALRFLRRLKAKVRTKARLRPDFELETHRLREIHNIFDFDDQFTAPMHGFDGALDYYQQCSSLWFLPKIKVPSLIVNAINDPFLPSECYPVDLINELDRVYFEQPDRGGHCGFALSQGSDEYWSEKRAVEFLNGKN